MKKFEPVYFETVYIDKGRVEFARYEDDVMPAAVAHRIKVGRLDSRVVDGKVLGPEVDVEIEVSVFNGDDRVVRFGEYIYGKNHEENMKTFERVKDIANRLLEEATAIHTAVMAVEKYLPKPGVEVEG